MLRKLISDLPRSKQKELPREGIVIMVDFYFPTKRKRDSDNLIGWMKHYFDGFADAGIVSDDEDIIALPPRKYQDKKNPRVEFQIMDSTGLKLVFNLVDPDKLD
jgi:Holliday junction resolvase RusA-like endonuclease